MKPIILALAVAVLLLLSGAVSANEQKIEVKDTTSEWSMLYNNGVATGKRLNANCGNKDWVETEILGETVKVCKKYKIFVKSPQFSKSPDAFQLGFLSTLR
ncbi:MAG: hypothetical protein ACE5EN_02180 [Nitrospinota bacterium]